MRMFLLNVGRAVIFLCRGEFRRVWNEVHVRLYRPAWELLHLLIRPSRIKGRKEPLATLELVTQHRVAFESPDHIAPKGTKENNSTNKRFVLHMDELLHHQFGNKDTLNFMDLGCSGGQLVKDFLDLKWVGVGLEGSDFSLKHRRANWARLANKNLFTCDITKPYQVMLNGEPARFHLITAWEVMEHLPTEQLAAVFREIVKHLQPGGYFVASTTETSDIHEGLELHQTQWTNVQWRKFVESTFPELEFVDPGLKIYQYVRYNFLHPSFLTYRRRK